MNRADFFTSLRRRESGVFGTSLSQSQVQGVEAILDAGSDMPISWLAYTLATAYGETGRRMQPITENMNYSAKRLSEMAAGNKRWRDRLAGRFNEFAHNPQKLANLVYSDILGNGGPETGDGWRYRGHGLPQTTGKDNFRKVGHIVGVDLVAHPERLLEMPIALEALLAGIRDGIYTGKRASDYLPTVGHATREQFRQSRRIINGTFEADKYAGYAMAFQAALVAGGYLPAARASQRPAERPVQPREVYPAPRPVPVQDAVPARAPEPPNGLLARLLSLFKGDA